MTSSEFRAALRELGINQAWLAAKLELDKHTVNRWAMGSVPVAPYVPFVFQLLRERRVIAELVSTKL